MNWIKTNLGSTTTLIRNGLNVNQLSTESRGLPITRIETISDEIINPNKVGYSNLNEENYSDWLLLEGDILLSHINSEKHLGKVAIYEGYPEKIVHGMNLLCLRSDRKIILPKYLFYFLRQYRYNNLFLRISKRAVNQASMSTGDLKNIKLDIPPLSEQRRIVEILDQADEIRKLRKQADEKAEKIIPALFYGMFGDPISNSKKYKIKSISEVGKVVTGSTPPSKFNDMWGGTIPFVTPGDLESKNGIIQRFVTIGGAENSRVIRSGSTLVCCIGATIGKVYKAKLKSAFNQQINAIEWDNNIIDDNYGFYLLKFLKQIVISKATSTTLPILKKSVFEQISIPIPPLDKQLKFSKVVTQFERIAEYNYNSKEIIEKLFNVILNKSFDGSLTEKWRETNMKELLQEMEEQKKYFEKVI